MLFACKGEKADEGGTYQATDTLPMLITQIQDCSRLYTAEVKVHKIVTHDDVIRLRGSLLQKDFNLKVPLGERKIAINVVYDDIWRLLRPKYLEVYGKFAARGGITIDPFVNGGTGATYRALARRRFETWQGVRP